MMRSITAPPHHNDAPICYLHCPLSSSVQSPSVSHGHVISKATQGAWLRSESADTVSNAWQIVRDQGTYNCLFVCAWQHPCLATGTVRTMGVWLRHMATQDNGGVKQHFLLFRLYKCGDARVECTPSATGIPFSRLSSVFSHFLSVFS